MTSARPTEVHRFHDEMIVVADPEADISAVLAQINAAGYTDLVKQHYDPDLNVDVSTFQRPT